MAIARDRSVLAERPCVHGLGNTCGNQRAFQRPAPGGRISVRDDVVRQHDGEDRKHDASRISQPWLGA